MTVRIVDNSERFLRRLYDAANKGVTNAAGVLADQMARTIVQNHGGTRSKPGEPPHSQTGQLRNSMARSTSTALYARAGTDVPYGRWLNNGTSRMAPRPWARPAYVMARGAMMKAFTATVRNEMRKV